ncbi:MAG: hypothetical protein JWQ25_118 [Daejeonella sp.]|nr:hypothetical protein [Daejeonella sp.]
MANLKSQQMCENLIYSIRESGCSLPIRLIHFGGKEIISPYVLNQVQLCYYNSFPDAAKQFIENLRSVLIDCPLGFLYRYLAWFSDWDEFIYSDNDIVALSNWEEMFEYLSEYNLVHADEEYTTKGIFNYHEPELVKKVFGQSALDSAITAGHIVVKRDDEMVADMNKAVLWFKQNPHIPKKHDQSLLHIAALIGSWRILNLCRSPYNWLSSWAGDYKNSLEIIQKIQTKGTKISHIHYSGGTPGGELAIQELLFSSNVNRVRLARLTGIGFRSLSGYEKLKDNYLRMKRFLNRNFSNL